MNSIYLSQSVDILVSNKPIRQYAHNGKIFVEAKNGAEYSIRLRNNTYWRVLAVCSIDGINAIDGQVADPDGAGYIIEGNSAYTIQGFRTSNDSVNAFRFAEKSNSYAAKSEETGGDTSNCGVIGVRFINEKIDWNGIWNTPKRTWTNSTPIWNQPTCYPNWTIYDSTTFYNGSSSLSSSGPPGELRCCDNSSINESDNQAYFCAVGPTNFDMGTEFSKKEIVDKVYTTEFKRGTLASCIEIYYASRQALQSMGINVDKSTYVTFPEPFPKAKFCKPPR